MVAITPPHNVRGAQRPSNTRLRAAVVVGLSAAACGSALVISSRRNRHKDTSHTSSSSLADSMRRMRSAVASNDTAVDCISGGLGEVAALLSLFPLDTLKVHCQARSISLREALVAVISQGPLAATRSLYAGVGTAAVGAAIVGAVHLSVYKYWKRLEHKVSTSTTTATSTVPTTGLLAVWGAIVSSVTVGALEAPLDQVKLRMQAGSVHGSPFAILMETLSSAGARQMFNSSFVPFVLKAIPHDVGEFVTFGVLSESESVSQCLGPLGENAKDALIGAAAGCAAALLSNPFDVICTKVQTSAPSSRTGAKQKITMRSSLVAFRDTAQAEFAHGGFRRFYVGVVPRLMQMVPASVIYWLVVEEVRRRIQRRGVAVAVA